MNTLLMVAVVLITLAILAQAGVLIGMFLMSRKVTQNIDSLVADSRRLMPPLESILGNLKIVSEDLTETGKIARNEAAHVQEIVSETHDLIRGQVFDVREAVLDTFDETRDILMRPIRLYAAMATGVAVGIRTFFSRRPPLPKPPNEKEEREYPAA